LRKQRCRKEGIVGGYHGHGLQMSQNSRNSKTPALRQKTSKLLAGSDRLRPSTNSAIHVSKSQFDRFVETAQKLGCDEDKEKFEETLRKIARQRPKKESGQELKKSKTSRKTSPL
jgi:hypothetical protein